MSNNIDKQDLLRGYLNLMEIIDFYIESNDIKFQPSSSASQNFEVVKKHYNNYGYFEVYNGGDHGFLGQEYNIKFRALHDYMHVTNNLSFSFEDEKQLSIITQGKFWQIAWNDLGKSAWECFVIRKIIGAEIKGQIEYFEKNKEYVKDQTKFIEEYLNVA